MYVTLASCYAFQRAQDCLSAFAVVCPSCPARAARAVCMSNSTTHPARIRIMDHGSRIPRCGPLGLTSATICIAKLHFKILWSGSLSRLPVPGSNFRPLVVANDQRDQRQVLGTGARPHSHGDRCVLAQHTSKAVNIRTTFTIPERIGTEEEFAGVRPAQTILGRDSCYDTRCSSICSQINGIHKPFLNSAQFNFEIPPRHLQSRFQTCSKL